MTKEAHEPNKEASRELNRVLEATVTAGADSLEFERENQGLVVYQYHGGTGVGAVAIPEKLQKSVIKEIVNRASLHRKPTGKFVLMLGGKEYEVFVKEYDSFGEAAFTLRLSRTRKGGR